MKKNKKYYWRHKKTHECIVSEENKYGDGFITGLFDGMPQEKEEYIKLTPNEMVDMGFNIHYFDNLKEIE